MGFKQIETFRDLKKAFDNILSEEFTGRFEDFPERFDDFLDGLLEDDYFGTEGQNDPRGDHRD